MRRRTARELTHLADGSLSDERREALLQRVLTSPELARALTQQRLAIEALRSLDAPAPAGLRKLVQRIR